MPTRHRTHSLFIMESGRWRLAYKSTILSDIIDRVEFLINKGWAADHMGLLQGKYDAEEIRDILLDVNTGTFEGEGWKCTLAPTLIEIRDYRKSKRLGVFKGLDRKGYKGAPGDISNHPDFDRIVERVKAGMEASPEMINDVMDTSPEPREFVDRLKAYDETTNSILEDKKKKAPKKKQQ